MNGTNTKVICNESNNPPETVVQGQFNIDFEYVPLTPMNVIDAIDNMANLIWQNYYTPMPIVFPAGIIRALNIVKIKDEADGW